MPKTPNGESADKMDKIMLLNIWAKRIKLTQESESTTSSLISAGMGKPTFPINPWLIQTAKLYWRRLEIENKEGKKPVVDYGHPQGELAPRGIVSAAMGLWYGINFTADDVLFTVGGAGSLANIFKMIKQENPSGKIVTPFPHYTLYAGDPDDPNPLHPINVMEEPGYRLTASALRKSLAKLDAKGEVPSAFLFCNPNNPLGTITSAEEWEDIAIILRLYPNVPIVFDEAYAEMSFTKNPPPALSHIASDLADRIIILRSGTKGLSAAGERFAVTITKNQQYMSKLLADNISQCGHAPISSQYIYSQALLYLHTSEGKKYMEESTDYYKQKVKFIEEKLKHIGAQLPDPKHSVEGTFYVLADLSDLIGTKLNSQVAQILDSNNTTIQTDEEIIYSLLLEDNLMLAPLSYFGIEPSKGIVRITCSGEEKELEKIIEKIDTRLQAARAMKAQMLIAKIQAYYAKLGQKPDKHEEFVSLINHITNCSNEIREILNLKPKSDFMKELNRFLYPELFLLHLANSSNSELAHATSTCQTNIYTHFESLNSKQLKQINQELEVLIQQISVFYKRAYEMEDSAKLIMQAFREHKARVGYRNVTDFINNAWDSWLSENMPRAKSRLYNDPSIYRVEYLDWMKYLNSITYRPTNSNRKDQIQNEGVTSLISSATYPEANISRFPHFSRLYIEDSLKSVVDDRLAFKPVS